MSYATRDTNWSLSAKGNYWRRVNGVILIVGRRKSDRCYWARRGNEFIPGSFATREQAQRAAEGNPGVEANVRALLDELGE